MTRISCDWCNLDRTDTVKVLIDEGPNIRTGGRDNVIKDICTSCISARFAYLELGKLQEK
jgi:hypothetical protein